MAPRTRNFRQLHEASELLLEKLGMLGPRQRAAFDEKFRMSWIFHDFALEGTVLSVAEIKAAIDPEIISTPALIPAYNHIASLYEGIDYILQSRSKRLTLNLDWLKRVHQILLPADKKDQVQYRKDNPIHRMYFHELAQADKISYRMRKLTDWVSHRGVQAGAPDRARLRGAPRGDPHPAVAGHQRASRATCHESHPRQRGLLVRDHPSRRSPPVLRYVAA